MHDCSILSQPVLVRDWQPGLPPGPINAVTLHWTAGDYSTVFPAYHFCLSGAARVVVAVTHDVRANMRDVRGALSGSYAAHTAGRNSYNVGIAICAMANANPHDFGACPLTVEQVTALCAVTAHVVKHYGIRLQEVRTHAEAALEDEYFGCGSANERWDLARLAPADYRLSAQEAVSAGTCLRHQIAQLC